MAHREMTAVDIVKRIDQGDLVVYLKEDNQRRWFWFPNVSGSDLMEYWEKCDITSYYSNPSRLQGDMVPVPDEDIGEENFDDYCDRAWKDERSKSRVCCMVESRAMSGEKLSETIAEFDAWCNDWFPNGTMWTQGWNSEKTWRAYAHVDFDSYLDEPE